MKHFTLWIPGQPIPMPRHRTTKTGHRYTPEKALDYKMAVCQLAVAAVTELGRKRPLWKKGEPVELDIQVFNECPQKFHRKRKPSPVRWNPGRSGDWDNYGKIICDALTGILWMDDDQVVDGRVRKYYQAQGAMPGVRVVAFDAGEVGCDA